MIRFSLILILLCLTTCLGEDRQTVVVAVGAPGTDEYGQQFQQWAARWKAAASKADADVTLIAGREDSRDQLLAAIRSSVASSTEPLWVVLIGHGTFDGREAAFNLAGPDMRSSQLAAELADVQRPIVVVNCTSCSAPFLKQLSAAGRAVVSATKDGSEIQFCRFGDSFSQAVAGLEADIDQDGQTSLMEAWLFAARRTQQFYDSDNRIATEHSLLDDNGDAKGSRSESYVGLEADPNVKEADSLDGKFAAKICLVRSDAERRLSTDQRVKRDALEQKLELLRQRRDQISAEAKYLDELEAILVPLSRIYEAADSDVP